jgi:hypothetical protein
LSCCWYVDTVSEFILAPTPVQGEWRSGEKKKKRSCSSPVRGRRDSSGQDDGRNKICSVFRFSLLSLLIQSSPSLAYKTDETCWHLPGVLNRTQ